MSFAASCSSSSWVTDLIDVSRAQLHGVAMMLEVLDVRATQLAEAAHWESDAALLFREGSGMLAAQVRGLTDDVERLADDLVGARSWFTAMAECG